MRAREFAGEAVPVFGLASAIWFFSYGLTTDTRFDTPGHFLFVMGSFAAIVAFILEIVRTQADGRSARAVPSVTIGIAVGVILAANLLIDG